MPRSLVSSFLLSIVLILLLGGILLASRWLLADIALTDATDRMNSWSENQAAFSVEDWQQAHDSLQRAIALKPGEAEYYRNLALLFERRSSALAGIRFGNEEIISFRKQAIAAHRTATNLSPAWPQSWSSLARMKAMEGELDEEFSAALNKAMVLGTYDARVNLELTFIATLAWPYISSDTALLAKLKAAIIRGLGEGGNVRGGLNFLRAGGLLEQICPELELPAMSSLVQQACEA